VFGIGIEPRGMSLEDMEAFFFQCPLSKMPHDC